MAKTKSDFAKTVRRLLAALYDWFDAHRDKIASAQLALREEDMLFLVVRKSAAFDAELYDSLTLLELSVANSPQLQQCNVKMIAVPPLSVYPLKGMLSSASSVYDVHSLR